MNPAPGEAILQTKIQIPRVRFRRVARRSLLDRLGQVEASRLTLVAAPAGFGKTTLLAAWANEAPHPVAWLTLDEADNVLDRFLTYLAAALSRVAPGVGVEALALIHSPRPLASEEFLTCLVNDLIDRPYPLVLVLDDYHVLESAPVQAAVEYLLDHLPDTLRLVIASRADPILPLARLRARGELLELRGADLRFSAHEAEEFLNQIMDLNLPAGQVEAIEERTEGWAAGLQLAALSLRDRKNPDHFIKVFTGTHHFILDYLAEEVLRRQPKHIQDFLLQTSILEWLTASLCDAILRDEGWRIKDESGTDLFIPHPSSFVVSDSPSLLILDYLERLNLFVTALDETRTAYRYHNLFADLLRYRLEQTYPDRIPTLHTRAARWFEDNGFVPEAVSHLLAAKDMKKAATLVEKAGEHLLGEGQANQLLGWLDILPASVFEINPRLDLQYCFALFTIGQTHRVEPHLRVVETRLASRLPEEIINNGISVRETLAEATASRALLASLQGNLGEVIRLSNLALQDLTPGHPMRSSLLIGLSTAYRMSGDSRQAVQALAEAAAFAQKVGQNTIAVAALCNQGEYLRENGELQYAAEVFRQAVALAIPEKGVVIPTASTAAAGLADIAFEWGNLPAARSYLHQALELDQAWQNQDSHIATLICQAHLAMAEGELNAGWELMAQVKDLAGGIHLTPMVSGLFENGIVLLELHYGDSTKVRQWLEDHPAGSLERLDFFKEQEAQIRVEAQVLLGIADSDPILLRAALDQLDQILPFLEASGRNGRLLEALALQALALSALGLEAEAQAALERSLELAAPQGYLRMFLDKGPAMQVLLQKIKTQGSFSPQAYLDRLLAVFAKEQPEAPYLKQAQEPGPSLTASRQIPQGRPSLGGFAGGPTLSARELEVLRLVAAGLSNQQVATRLVLAPGTVKRHLHNIFEELEVTSRSQAIARAHELGLLR
ncbi:MAG: LuxR C-terminal-related transcriptional regulator [Chloroflexi bacterium]|nr:LuxR C-terminal-related transcriptional regulator [Chloroflexota bacterium]